MPTYEYKCDACGHSFERFQSMTEKPVRTCPRCKRRKVRRVIGAGAAVIFKGSGFYQTDYRSAEYKQKQKKESEASGSGGEKKSGTSEASKKSGSDAKSGD